ncbi:MAG: EAL domain-containing protein [Mesorhizobium sp.]|uniref:putative bifunctional diguanylate cyclase/phosphodiesterase n=1 Tax=Mesorhizobium sp. TaxID=1871066 RepID=UPI000FEA5DB2|nr:GGDEF domain-containing phosphodiesterase [Mesorhizobium sp.]RWI31460.1 MAG: phosphodiesterase [Mesorhizobium sp.]TIO54440.1 MAG: EAL domain-containing protein [Mesorhizobium sp.]TIO56573.1 MAG: EAL domain-containing protein [Mesorhizobium sp.]TJV57525.1 MAG: EAL domain-containing protein [Mesorhizobium sp.]
MQRPSAARLGDLLAGDLRAFGGPSTTEPLAGRIRAEQVNIVLRNTPLGMVANILNAATFVMALWGSPDQTKAILWASVVIAAAGFVGLRARSSFRSVKPRSVSRRTTQNLVRNAFLFGTWWGALPILFFSGATSAAQVVITCLSAGMIAGGAASFYTIPIAAIAYTLPIFVGSAVAIVWVEDAVNLPVAILIVSYATTLFRAVLAHASEFTQRFILQAESENAIRRDVLTSLPNRFSFNERLENALVVAKQFDQHFALLLFDLNNFDEVNDHFGRAMADAVLVEVAARLRKSTRESDDIARLEGGEFAIIAARDIRPDQISSLAKQITNVMRAPFLIQGREIYCRASIGIALAPTDGLDANQLLRCVDTALYRANMLGTGSIQFFSASDDEAAARRHALERDLASALANDQLWLAFQPFLDLGSDRIRGFEALLRWQHPTLGAISPSEFISIAEETGLIHSIGHWAVKTACLAAAQWPRDLRVSVNLSAVQLKDKALLDGIVMALSETGLEPERLEVEITESVLISDFEDAISLLQSLSCLSVTLALDDFGTGYSSLTYLRKLPLSRLKIDRSFVQDMLTDADCAAIVRSLVELAHELRIEVTAEGVETPEQLDYLRRVRCDEAQGYLIGKPDRIDDIPGIAAKPFGQELNS